MTHDELIQLVQDKPPEQLTLEEIEALRDSLGQSAELRDVLMGELQLEEYLARSLGRVRVSIDDILIAATAPAALPQNRTAALLGWTVSICVGLALLAIIALLMRHAPQPIADQRPDSAAPHTTNPLANRQAGEPVDRAEAPAGEPPGDQIPTPAGEPAAFEPFAPRQPPLTVNTPIANPPSSTPGVRATAQQPNAATADVPWPELAPLKEAPRAAADAAFSALDIDRQGLAATELKRWLEPVAGQPNRIDGGIRGECPVAWFDGLYRLKAPWPNDAVLHLAPFDCHGFAIYFWQGEAGVALRYYDQPRAAWAAYRILRKPGETRPSSYALVAVDDGRFERTLRGPFDVRHQDNALIVNRGDIRLLTAPLAGPPTDVFFERHAAFRSFRMSRGGRLADDAPPPAANVLSDSRPHRLEWTTHLPPGATFGPAATGPVVLTAEKTSELAWAAVRVPQPSLYEVVFQVDRPTPGTGVYLGDDSGKPVHMIGFFREQRTGATMFGFMRPDQNGFDCNFQTDQQLTPAAAERQWLRVVAGCGTFKCWTSGDGVHWSRPFDPLRNVQGAYSHVGLFSLKAATLQKIGLHVLRVSELTPLTELAQPALREKIPAALLTTNGDRGAWLLRVLDSQPPHVDSTAWRHACTIRTLAAGPTAAFGNHLLYALLADVITSSLPAERRRQLLDQAAELIDCWEQPESYRFSQLYEQLGRQLIREGNPQPYTAAGQALLTAPIWTYAQYQVMPESLVYDELMHLVCADDWQGVEVFCQRIRFWNQASQPETRWPDNRSRIKALVDWADPPSAQHNAAGSRRGKGMASPSLTIKRHPLVVELSKEGYNILAEVQAALSEESYTDACQIISSVKPHLALGLLPDSRDSQLLVSLPQAVVAAMRDHPRLQSTMNDQFGRLGRLRVQQAIAASDALAVRAATVQFFGTPAAAEAHQWLGDRELAIGGFARALVEYDQALAVAAPAQHGSLEARTRLAAALLGRDRGQPVTANVVLHGAEFAPRSFEDLVREMRERAARSPAGAIFASDTETAPAESGLPVARYEARTWGRFQGDSGQNAGKPQSPAVDWLARQLAVAVHQNMLFVSNRFLVVAYDLASGQHRWSQGLGGEQGQAHEWPLTPMRPVVAGDRLFVRRLTKNGPELACLEAASGKVLWKARPPDFVASEPIMNQDELLALTAAGVQNNMLHLQLTTFNPATGEVLAQTPLLRLNNAWNREVPCSVAKVGGRLVANVGGSVLCSNLQGQALWVRRQVWLPPYDFGYFETERTPPLVAGQRLFIVQPGVPEIECLDLETGRRYWQQPLAGIRRLVGMHSEKLLVETDQGLMAFDQSTGGLCWRHDDDQMLNAQSCPAAGDIVYTRREQVSRQPDQWRPVIVWLNPSDGSERGCAPVAPLIDASPQFGPLFANQNRLIAFFGRGQGDTTRDLVELVSVGAGTVPGRALPPALAYWAESNDDLPLRRGLVAALPGWTYLRGAQDKRVGFVDEWSGERELCATLATRERPVILAREISLPAGTQARLKLKVGHEPSHHWTCDVRIAGQSLQTQAIEAASSVQGWKEWEISLAPYAGQTVWIVVEQHPEGASAHGYWKQLEIVN